VAQLIARPVWDREVEGLSPFTPTKEKRLSLDSLFSLAWLADSNLRVLQSKTKKVWRSEYSQKKHVSIFSGKRAKERSKTERCSFYF
jgi:hypothetical protein